MDGGRSAPIEVRQLRTHDEFVRCVELQHDVWGASFSERVSVGMLKVVQRIGGIAAGAFEEDDRLVGFVFGLTGVEGGRLVHWSDMLAVREGLRDHGIGRRLKEFQRDTVRKLGVSRIYWTFDPLVSRNAHFNLTRLGAHVVEYVPDMYGGDTNSALHRGVGTDRFIVAWDIDRAGAGIIGDEAANGESPHIDAPVLNPVGADGLPAIPNVDGDLPTTVRVAVPEAIERVQAHSVENAARWRASTRRAFMWALDKGYHVSAFHRDDGAHYGFYVCTRDHR
ncbi:MAG TPA: GNAT family N-acetyltransferase [Gemmatimonadaceae bacterium]|nr:GNAT family N-acetyltransferase [Gemmatimonadaceae bacterium]